MTATGLDRGEVWGSEPVDSTVLILGESGTGNDRIARHIHTRSASAAAPFLALHCGSLAEPLLV